MTTLCLKCFKEWLKESRGSVLIELHCDYFDNETEQCDRCGEETSCYIEVRRLKE